MNPAEIKKVYVVFKTHLDIGFTDFAGTVLDQYKSRYIPQALDLARKVNTPRQKKFVWTVGSFLIYDTLTHGTPEQIAALEEGIRRGDLCWHGLACTSHSELQDEALLEFNLSLSEELDRRFGKKTIAAKMTDVPGHTRAIVPHLAAHGIRFLHIGVNPASMVPEVPETFVWKSGDQSVIVQYSSQYGSAGYVEGMDCVLEFAHTNDNMGPQGEEALKSQLAALAETYPNAEITAATMDDYARELVKLQDRLPVIEEEIGDTWIHGVASDPRKTGQYRAILALKDRWLAQGKLTAGTPAYRELMLNLLMIPEHTWGLDFKSSLGDFRNWDKADFRQARKNDRTTLENLTERNLFLQAGIRGETVLTPSRPFSGSYSRFEASHQEQRDYLRKAAAALPEALQQELRTELDRLDQAPSLEAGEPVLPGAVQTIGPWCVAFGPDGAVSFLSKNGKIWIETGAMGRLGYTTYSAADCITNFYSYCRNIRQTFSWAEADFSKPGVEFAEGLEHREYGFCVQKITRQGNRILAELAGNPRAADQYGCPRKAMIAYDFGTTIRCRLYWADKDANKTPEALWFDMKFDVENENLWKIRKLGTLISPLEVVRGGNRHQHCAEAVEYRGADGTVRIRNVHGPLVSVGGRWLYGDYRTQPSLDRGFSWCLFDNKWGTNFPMWCEENCSFEYEISIENRNERG